MAAKSFYVDAVNGVDANNGTSASSPWRTLQRVNRQIFKPGDKIFFKAGRTYEGQFKPKGSGALNNPIKVDRYGKGDMPILQGSGKVAATVYLFNVQCWQLNNLAVSNFGEQRRAKRFGIHIEARNFGTVHHMQLKNILVRDVNGSLVKNEGGGAGIVFSNSGDSLKTNFDGILIENCTIKRTARNGILINGNWERNKWFPSRNVVIRKNLLEGVPGDGIVPIGCDSALIEYNTMRDCPRMLPDGEAAAGIWPWSCDNTIIQYNEVSDHKAPWDGQGFDSDWNCKNTLIQYNYSHDNEGGFILICNDGGASKKWSSGNTGTVIRYNLSVNDGLRALGKHAGFSPVVHITGPVKNTRVYNNVFYIRAKPAGVDTTLIATGDWGGIPDSTVFANNIFYAAGKVVYNLEKSTHSQFEHNLYYGEHFNKPPDPYALFTDPLFILIPKFRSNGLNAADNFKLRKQSPAAGKGIRMTKDEICDFFGNPLVNPDRPSVGVHELIN